MIKFSKLLKIKKRYYLAGALMAFFTVLIVSSQISAHKLSKMTFQTNTPVNQVTAPTPTPNATPEPQTATPTTSSVSSQPTSSYQPTPSCSYVTVPYQTIYQNDPTRAAGTEFTSQFGWSGTNQVCGGTTKVITPPTNKIVLQGTKQAAPAPTGVTLQQAQLNCSRFGDSSAYEQCLHAYGY